MKPLIGINVDVTKGPPCEARLQTTYSASIAASGGIPVMLPPMGDEHLRDLVARLDGIVFIGGRDYFPSRYSQETDDTVELVDEQRDDFDFRLFERVFHDSSMPILGICLGNQLVNIGLGGSLIQDIPKHFPDSQVTHASPDGWNKGFNEHVVELDRGSRLFDIYKKESVIVSTSHHQCIGETGEGLKVVSRAEDGVIEGIELQDSRFVLGIQWHPERDYERSSCIFDALINTASFFKKPRRSKSA